MTLSHVKRLGAVAQALGVDPRITKIEFLFAPLLVFCNLPKAMWLTRPHYLSHPSAGAMGPDSSQTREVAHG